jgi:hypothetical protein
MRQKNVEIRAQEVLVEMLPVIEAVRKRDRGLADQMKRAAPTIAGAWGYVSRERVAHLERRLDQVCAITWTLSR